MSADLASVGRVAGWLLVAGLTIAAAAAVVVLVQGDFDQTEARVIYTSLGFALASATGSAGARAMTHASAGLRALGVATVACSVVAFALFALVLWGRDLYEESTDLWRVIGCITVAGIAGAHACLVLGARKSTDNQAVRLLTVAAVCLGVFDALGVILPLSGLVDDVDGTWARVFGSALVVLMLASVLPPLLRKLGPTVGRVVLSTEY